MGEQVSGLGSFPPPDCMVWLKDQALMPDRLAEVAGLLPDDPTVVAARERVVPVPPRCPYVTPGGVACGASAALTYEHLMGAGGKMANTQCVALAAALLRALRPTTEAPDDPSAEA